MRPSGDLNLREYGLRDQKPLLHRSRVTSESMGTNEERTVRAKRQRERDGQEVCNLKKTAV